MTWAIESLSQSLGVSFLWKDKEESWSPDNIIMWGTSSKLPSGPCAMEVTQICSHTGGGDSNQLLWMGNTQNYIVVSPGCLWEYVCTVRSQRQTQRQCQHLSIIPKYFLDYSDQYFFAGKEPSIGASRPESDKIRCQQPYPPNQSTIGIRKYLKIDSCFLSRGHEKQ